MNKDFIIDMLFDKPELKWIAKRKFDKKKDLSSIQNEEFDLPLVNAKNGNNGIMYFGRSSDFSSVEGGIDIVNDGAVSAGNVYPQPHRIGVLYNAYIITLKNGMNTNRQVLEYLACVMEKTIKYRFNYSNKAGWDKVKEISISLPIKVDENNKPIIDDTYFYHKEGFIPDFDYMEKYIAELEGQRIAELERYLVATGLNDYELTDDDKKVLSEKVDTKEFVMHDIFELLTVKKAIKTSVRNYQNNEFCVPVVYAKFGDNGIMYWGRQGEFTTYNNVLSIVYNGVIAAGKCYAQEEETGILAESYFIRYKFGKVPFLANLYMSKVIEHKIYPLYSRETLAIWNNRVENDSIELPVKSDGTPDFDYMEKYIKAIEKVVICDVAKYKLRFKDTIILANYNQYSIETILLDEVIKKIFSEYPNLEPGDKIKCNKFIILNEEFEAEDIEFDVINDEKILYFNFKENDPTKDIYWRNKGIQFSRYQNFNENRMKFSWHSNNDSPINSNDYSVKHQKYISVSF